MVFGDDAMVSTICTQLVEILAQSRVRETRRAAQVDHIVAFYMCPNQETAAGGDKGHPTFFLEISILTMFKY